MDRILLLVTVTIIATTAAKAQSVTYNHDSPKQNQVTVMETGTGALSPDLYYSILHNKYKKSAAVKNKLSFPNRPYRSARSCAPSEGSSEQGMLFAEFVCS
mgnify:CR=1 FL=1